MNILIPDSWLREYLDTQASAKDIQKYLSLCGPSVERIHEITTSGRKKDYIYDVEVTTNRVDCMSVYGLAREAAAILPQFQIRTSLLPLKLGKLNRGAIPNLSVENDFSLCKRILAVKIENVPIAPSPPWLSQRLLAVGQRPLNNLVDITNYVMWETGHPAHVFDFDRLSSGKMIIRSAKKGEQITTLDDKSYTLAGGEVVIDNGSGQIIDLPSVMGTKNSVVTDNTRSALLFVDDVVSSKVRFASMTHAIRTQAATLLEKDVDPELSLVAMARMIEIIKTLYPQAKIGNLLDLYQPPPPPNSISLPLTQITQLIGVNIPVTNIKNILSGLNFQVLFKSGELTVTPPSWRAADVQIPEDVIEEISRMYGYHNIPPVLMTGRLPPPDHNLVFYWENRIKTALKYLGFTEVYTYSLIPEDSGLKLKNPLSSEWQFLRTGLFSSHRELLDQNRGKAKNLSFFEIAHVYLPRPGSLPEEQARLILSSSVMSFSSFKGAIESLLQDLGINNLSLDINSVSGNLYWEIPLSEILCLATDRKAYTPISKFTPIIEDINILYQGNYTALIKRIKSVSPLITDIEFIDIYQDKLTLRLTFHSPEKQLSGMDIAPIRTKLHQS